MPQEHMGKPVEVRVLSGPPMNKTIEIHRVSCRGCGNMFHGLTLEKAKEEYQKHVKECEGLRELQQMAENGILGGLIQIERGRLLNKALRKLLKKGWTSQQIREELDMIEQYSEENT